MPRAIAVSPMLAPLLAEFVLARRRLMRKKAAALAMEPAWEPDEETSPRDPEYKAQDAVCHPRDKATELLRKPDARKQATDIMRIYQVRRKAKMHW